jgi:protein required for attachment to host cells
MDANWIVVANAGRARFFSQPKDGAALEEMDDLVHTAARLRTSDTETDDLGRRSASGSRHGSGAPNAPNGYEPHQTPAEHQSEVFAKTVVGRLAEGRRANRFGKLIVVASPEFLGLLRKEMDAPLAAAVSLEVDKDYTHSNASQLREQIDARRVGA